MEGHDHPLMYDAPRIAAVGVEQCQYWCDLAAMPDSGYGSCRSRWLSNEKRAVARQWSIGRMKKACEQTTA